MFNTPLPTVNELPSTRKLVRSTVIAILVAVGLLVTVVMPSEYAVDPTGVGRALGLTQMGELKIILAQKLWRMPRHLNQQLQLRRLRKSNLLRNLLLSQWRHLPSSEDQSNERHAQAR
jgi:hypothetical protein